MSLRVNERRGSTDAYLQRLRECGIAARPCTLPLGHIGASALLLERPVPVQQLPGFEQGLVSVQDIGAQCAAPLLDVSAGQRVLDACAAPGGKTGHLLEQVDVDLLALDRDAQRSARIRSNLERLGLRAQIQCADAAQPEVWWDGRPFDRILLDAPCTASGVVRRHPDAKWLRRPADIDGFARQQKALLEALWRVLAPGGKLLYVTCSVFPEENIAQVDDFLKRHADARLGPILPNDGQLLPNAQHDGFYYALVEKRA